MSASLAPQISPAKETEAAVVANASIKAASLLGISNRRLGRILGLSEASVSRLSRGGYAMRRGDKSFELGLLFVRLFRALDALAGGDEAVARSWMRNDNLALGGKPIDMIQTVPGLVNVLAYLDARRARI